jgi:hypothetical protein
MSAEDYADLMGGVDQLTRAELIERLDNSVKAYLWEQSMKRELVAQVERLREENARLSSISTSSNGDFSPSGFETPADE